MLFRSFTKSSPVKSLFANNEPGVWYDLSDITTLYQDSAGTTPVTAVEQPVGLMLDKSQGLALGPELITNGNFNDGTTDWSINSTYGSMSNVTGELQVTTTAVSDYYGGYQSFPTVSGRMYKISVTCRLGTASAGRLSFGSAANVGNWDYINFLNTSNTTITHYVYAFGNTAYYSLTCNTGTAYFDNVTIKELAGNHAFQYTAGNRPTLSARVNLLTYSEQFDNAAWSKNNASVSANATADPLGGNTADKIVENATTNAHQIYYPSITVSASSYTASVYAKAAERTAFAIDFYGLFTGGLDKYAVFDLSTGVVSSTAAGVSATITSAGGGWYKCTATYTGISTALSYYIAVMNGLSWASNYNYTGNGTSGVYIWGADIRPTNIGAALPSYQRVTTSTDYDTVGFPLYLKTNGTSSAMATYSINFTSTAAMTVVTGVRKLSDAALGMLAELSVSAGTSAGTFYVLPQHTDTKAYYSSAGTSGVNVSSGANAAPYSSVITGISAISTPLASIRVNGTQVGTSSASQGTGTFGTYPLYLFARAGTSLWFNGQFYGAIICGASKTTAEIQQAESYENQKAGGLY